MERVESWYWYWLCILITLCDAFSLHDFYRRVLVGYMKTNIFGRKRLFCQSWKIILAPFFIIMVLSSLSSCPSSEKSKKTAGTVRRWKYDLCWHHVLPKQICFVKDSFLWFGNKESVNSSWRSIGSDFSCLYHHCPTPTFPFLLCLSLGILILMLATNGC